MVEKTRLWPAGLLLLCAASLQAQSLTIAPSGYLTVPVGGSLQCTAVASGFSIAGVKWEVGSLQGGNATTGTVTTGLAGGLYTAPAVIPGQNPQSIMAVATATNGSKYSASVYVYILSPPPVITSVSPNPLTVGTSTVTVTGSGFTSSSFIWDGGVQYPTQKTSANTLTASVYTGSGSTSATFTVVTAGSTSNAIVVPVGIGAAATYSLVVMNGTGSGSYHAGAVVNIAANAAPSGQKFQSWSGASVANPASASTTITMPAANTTVTAAYTAIPTYTLTVVNGTGSGTYASGAVVNIAANAAPSGQQFQSWTGAVVANSTSAGTTITMPAANTTVTAAYTAIPTYTLTVVNGTGSGTYASGAVVNIAANAAPSGQKFQSWTGAAVANSTSASTTITMPAANTTVTAAYTAIPTYTLTVVNGTGSGTYASGAVVNIAANAAPSGQQFQSWTGAAVANSTSAGTTITMPAANTTVTAAYTAIPTYTLTVVNGTGSGTYASGAVVNIAANAAPSGQQFQSWTGAVVANSTSAGTTITMPAANTTVTAAYTAIPTYTLTVVNGTGSGTYASGAVVNIAANAAPSGQQFQSWTGAAVANSTSAGTTITMPAASSTVTANYAAIVSGLSISSVSPSPLPSGTVTVTVTGTGFNSYPTIWAGGVQYPTLQPAPNTLTTSVYIAPGWPSLAFTVHNGGMVSNTLTVPVSGGTPPVTYTLTVVNGTGNGVSSGSYAAGTMVSIAANAAPPGQSFSGWSGAAVANASSASTTLTMPAANTTLTANFVATATYTLTVINGTNSGSYAAGTVVTISANTAPTGQVFSSWSGAPVTSPTSSTTTLAMPAANTTVTANYSTPLSGPYTVTYSAFGSTAGTGPTDPSLYTPGQAVTVQANLGYLFNPGHAFIGWNTSSDGSGASYGIGAALTMGNSNVTLYPQWNTQDWPVSVWGGARVAIVLKADSSVWTWGMNTYGQLGDGTTTDRSLPVQVLGPNGAGTLNGVIAVMGGEAHNLALKSDGTVWAWGMNMVNQLGNGNTTNSSTPVPVSGLSSVVSIASRAYHSLALKSDGTVWAWGTDRSGALGNGVADSNTDYPVPVQVQGLSSPLMLTSGYYFSVALKPDHTLVAWGSNTNGQLGNGTTTPSYTPMPVLGIDHVIWVSAGWTHVVAIKSDGTVWTWGANYWGGIYPGAGMLGDGTAADHYLPEQVPGLAGAIQASGGDSFTSVLLRDGTVWTFGSNAAGQLGTGSFSPVQSLVPVQVQGLSNIVSITARDHHNQAIRSDGTVWSWGSGQNGELGNGTGQNSPTAVQVIWP